jgi:2'-5' RNA ligase
MATDEVLSRPESISLNSPNTALCIIPPEHLWPKFDRLRSLYDKAYEKWPPHINLVYPYVPVESLPSASALVASEMGSILKDASLDAIKVRLDAADVFSHRHDNTIFVCDNDKERVSRLEELRNFALRALGQNTTTKYRMHLTIGQSQDLNASPHKFLLEKASLLPPEEWTVDKLYILVRERMQIDGNAFSQMKLWGTSE